MGSGCGYMQAFPSSHLELLRRPENVQEVRLAGRRLEVGGGLGPFLQGFLSGPLEEPVPDGLQAVFLLADSAVALRGTLVRPSPR